MEGLRFFLVFLLSAFTPVFSNVVVIIGDRLSFQPTKGCMQGGASLVHRLLDGTERRVADFLDGWRPGPGYEDRVLPGEVVVLNSANVNDNGVYELVCGPGNETLVQVDAVPASRVSVTEGEDMALSFHHITVGAGGPAAYVRCDRNEELVFEVDLSSRDIAYGAGLESRVSVSSNWPTHEDFSPTLRRAQVQDQGDYFFYAMDKAKRRTREMPVAVRVEVKTNQSDPTTTPPTPACPTQRPATETGTIVAAVLVSVAVGFGLGWFVKSYESSVPACCGSEAPAPAVAMGLLPESDPAGPHVNGGPARLDVNNTD